MASLPSLSSYEGRDLRSFNQERLSPCETQQGEEGTCMYHAYSKLFIQNMVSQLIDLSMTPREKTKMSACIKKHPIDTSKPIGNYSADTCSEKGYWKIILFYYFFNYFRRNQLFFIREEFLHLVTTMHPRASVLLPLGHEDGTFQMLQKRITDKIKELGISWKFMMFFYDDSLNPHNPLYDKEKHTLVNTLLKRILKLKLYCVLGTKNQEGDYHALLLTGYHGNNFHIKNSWGDKYDVVSFDTFPTIYLRGKNSPFFTFTCETIRFLFPIMPTMVLPDEKGTFKTIEYLTAFMDSYEHKIGGTRRRKTIKKLNLKKSQM